MKAPASATAFSPCRALSRAAASGGCDLRTRRQGLQDSADGAGSLCGELTDKIELVALNKIDAVTPNELKKQKDRFEARRQENAASDFGAPPAQA